MKRHFNLAAIILLLLAINIASFTYADETEVAEYTDKKGDWIINEEVDDFGDPTGKEVLSTTVIDGTFSNTATTDSELKVVMFYVPEDKCFAFRMLEYGETPATFVKSDALRLLYKIGDETTEARLYGVSPNSDLYLGPNFDFNNIVDNETDAKIFNMGGWIYYEHLLMNMLKEDQIRFVIYVGNSKYNFTISTNGFKDLLTKRADELYKEEKYDEAAIYYASLKDKEKEKDCRYHSNNCFDNTDIVRVETILTEDEPKQILSPSECTVVKEIEGTDQVFYCFDTIANINYNEYVEYLASKDIVPIPDSEYEDDYFYAQDFADKDGNKIMNIMYSKKEEKTTYGNYYLLYLEIYHS